MSNIHTAATLAERFGLILRGDSAQRIDGVATLARAGEQRQPGQGSHRDALGSISG